MRSIFAVLLVAALSSACTTVQEKKVALMPEAILKLDQRLLEECPKFQSRDAKTLTEAELLVEFGTLTTAYSKCHNNHKALSDLIKQELTPK